VTRGFLFSPTATKPTITTESRSHIAITGLLPFASLPLPSFAFSDTALLTCPSIPPQLLFLSPPAQSFDKDGADCERCWYHRSFAGARARAPDTGSLPHQRPRRPVLVGVCGLCVCYVWPLLGRELTFASEMLYEDPKFPERQLAALVLSKVSVCSWGNRADTG